MAVQQGLKRKAHFLGSKIKGLRKRNNLTLEDLSVRCIQVDAEAGPSVSYLSMIENGKRVPSERLLQIIADLESEGHASVLTNKILEDLIRFYGDAMGGVLGTLIERSIAAFVEQEKQVRTQLRSAMENTPDKLLADLTQQYAEFWQTVGGFTPRRDDEK